MLKSTELEFILLINVKVPITLGILTIISRIMTGFDDLNLKKPLILTMS